jgi:hypothetical protein
MPITPFHFGPGILIKSVCRKRFSLTVFILVQIIIDSEVAWNAFLGHDRLHTFFHSYLGSSAVIGIVLAFILFLRFFVKKKFIQEKWLRNSYMTSAQVSFGTAFISAAIGAWSHVFLDSIMHMDMIPWYPIGSQNFMLHKISLFSLHLGCVLSALVGMGIWITRSLLLRKM